MGVRGLAASVAISQDRFLGGPLTLLSSFGTPVYIAEIGGGMGFTMQQGVRGIQRVVFAAIVVALLAPAIPVAAIVTGVVTVTTTDSTNGCATPSATRTPTVARWSISNRG